MSPWRFVGVVLVKVLLGAFFVSAALALIVASLLRREVHEGLIALGLLVGVLWFLWSMLPTWFREFIRWALKGKKKKDDRHGR
jgi:hypothetical protein